MAIPATDVVGYSRLMGAARTAPWFGYAAAPGNPAISSSITTWRLRSRRRSAGIADTFAGDVAALWRFTAQHAVAVDPRSAA